MCNQIYILAEYSIYFYIIFVIYTNEERGTCSGKANRESCVVDMFKYESMSYRFGVLHMKFQL